MCNITKQNLFLILVILVSLSVLSSCNEKEKNVASTLEACPEKTIRVELGGQILKLERERVHVSKSVADSAQSLDLSKDCSISIARNPDSVTVYYFNTMLRFLVSFFLNKNLHYKYQVYRYLLMPLFFLWDQPVLFYVLVL